MVAAVVALDRGQLARAVLVQVGLGDQATAALAGFDDGRADPALVEAVDAAVADRPERAGQVPLHQFLADLERLAPVQENARGGRIFVEVSRCGLENLDIALVQRKAFFGQRNGRAQQCGAIHRAIFLARVFHPGHAAGHADGQVALGAQALDHVALLVQVHVGGRGQRCFFAEIEKRLAAVRQLHGHETAAREIARGRIHHGQCITHGHSGVDRVAAALEHVDSDPGGQVLGGDHHPVFGGDRRNGCGMRLHVCARKQARHQQGGAQPGHGIELVHQDVSGDRRMGPSY